MANITQDAIRILKQYIEKKYNKNLTVASNELEISYRTLRSWMVGDRFPSLTTIQPLLEKIGAKLVLDTDEPSKEICFVDAKIVSAEGSIEKPEAEDYLAVPLVEEVGAGTGIIPQGKLLSWFLVYRYQPAVLNKTNLIAVQIGENSTSMLPTLNPLDIVLIDRSNRDVSVSGRMFLVLDPDGAGKIKRVAVEKVKKDFRIIYYSDNTVNNPPEIFSLNEDFYGEWDRCIVGRVIWAWSDVSNK